MLLTTCTRPGCRPCLMVFGVIGLLMVYVGMGCNASATLLDEAGAVESDANAQDEQVLSYTPDAPADDSTTAPSADEEDTDIDYASDGSAEPVVDPDPLAPDDGGDAAPITSDSPADDTTDAEPDPQIDETTDTDGTDSPSDNDGTTPSTEESALLSVVATPSQGTVPLTVSFTLSDADGTDLSQQVFTWVFGDGESATTGATCSHVYAQAGSFTVEVCPEGVAPGTSSDWCAQTTVAVSSVPVEEEPTDPVPNLEPEAVSMEVEVETGSQVSVVLRGSDPEGAPLAFRIVTPPDQGGISSPTPQDDTSAEAVYSPAADYVGVDSFTYVANDGVSDSAPTQVDIVVLNHALPPLLITRTPQWPLKTERALYTDEQIAAVRNLCKTSSDTTWLTNKLVSDAAYWIGKSNEELRAMIPDGRVWRSQDVSIPGCPIHGSAVYEHGTYPWIIDRDHPFTVRCPVGGETYPSNDFDAYYRSDFRDPRFLDGDYPDDGQGWYSPSGDRYSFVAYAAFWNWYTTWRYTVTTLSQAYIVTGERIYAEKALAMLDRMAEVYPGLDYNKQCAEPVTRGRVGKALYSNWETYMLSNLAVAYDLVWDALVAPDPVEFPWRSAEEIRANIEANLLEEGIDAVDRDQIRSNYGRHQAALAYAVAVRQNGPRESRLQNLLYTTGGDGADEGLEYALYNHFSKDGFPPESSPIYNFSPLTSFNQIAHPLSLIGYDLTGHPKMHLAYDGPLAIVCAGQFMPLLGDSGDIYDEWLGPTVPVYKTAYQRFGESEYAWALDYLGGLKYTEITSFEDLFQPSLVQAARQQLTTYTHHKTSRFFDGYGLTILNNAEDTTAVSSYFGIHGGHGHCDRLGIEMFSHGRRMSPDLGYPDFMNGYIASVRGWTQNTISHNCMLIDDGMQTGNYAGQILRFHEAPEVHFVDLDGNKAYSQAEVYRRSMLLVDVGPDDSYLVDVFRVRGGERHVLSMHGFEGTFDVEGAAFSAPVTEGTLAGADVPYGHPYDDPVLGAPGYTGAYSSYTGSGYQYLFNWQHAVPSELVTASWQAASEPVGLMRIHVPAHSAQDIILADAYVSPVRKIPAVLKYMLVRRDADAEGNTFVVVWELAGEQPFIDSIQRWDTSAFGSGSDEVVALTITHGTAVDTVAIAPDEGSLYSFATTVPAAGTWMADSSVFLVREDGGTWQRKFASGGTFVYCGRLGSALSVPATVRGDVVAVDYTAKTVVVNALPAGGADNEVGRVVRICNDKHSCVYTIADAEAVGGQLVLTLSGSEMITGRIRVSSVVASTRKIYTPTYLLYPYNSAGMTLATSDFASTAPIDQASSGVFTLKEGTSVAPFVAGNDAWIVDFGVGDQVEIEMSQYQTR